MSFHLLLIAKMLLTSLITCEYPDFKKNALQITVNLPRIHHDDWLYKPTTLSTPSRSAPSKKSVSPFEAQSSISDWLLRPTEHTPNLANSSWLLRPTSDSETESTSALHHVMSDASIRHWLCQIKDDVSMEEEDFDMISTSGSTGICSTSKGISIFHYTSITEQSSIIIL